MKLVTVNSLEIKSITPKKAVEVNVEWVIAFAVAGVKPIIVEACVCIEEAVGSDMVKFYRAGEKTPCAMFNSSQILSVFQRGCIKKGR